MAEQTGKLNVLKELQEIRVTLVNMELKKSGHNDYGKYDYFELSDFLPAIQKLSLEHGVICIYKIGEKEASLSICDINDESNCLTFVIPVAELSLKGANAIQNVGGLTTYTRRYLYMIAFEIAENDEFDPVQDTAKDSAPTKTGAAKQENINNQKITEKDIASLRSMMESRKVADSSVLNRYKLSSFEDMSFSQFNSAMKTLGNMPEVIKK